MLPAFGKSSGIYRGTTISQEYLFTGDLMTAAEAERIGLINHVVPADQLDEGLWVSPTTGRRRHAVDPLD